MRGYLYMNRMDCFTRRASVSRDAGVARPIDEIMADISVRRRNGEKVQTKDWLRYVGEWIGDEAAEEHLHNMKSGVLMDLEDMKTTFGGLVPEDQQNVLAMGFDRNSLTTGVVQGLVDRSQAARAGLLNGDSITWIERPELCETHYANKCRMKIVRDGQVINIEYWPRMDKTVKVWQSRKKDE